MVVYRLEHLNAKVNKTEADRQSMVNMAIILKANFIRYFSKGNELPGFERETTLKALTNILLEYPMQYIIAHTY